MEHDLTDPQQEWYRCKKETDPEYLERKRNHERAKRAQRRAEAKAREEERLLRITMEIERNRRITGYS